MMTVTMKNQIKLLDQLRLTPIVIDIALSSLHQKSHVDKGLEAISEIKNLKMVA